MGFAKSSPAAQRPVAHGPRRLGGPEAHTVLLSSGKSTHMHRFSSGLGTQMKDGEFEFVIILIIISIFSFIACCQVKNVAILCCFRLFTRTNRNKDSND